MTPPFAPTPSGSGNFGFGNPLGLIEGLLSNFGLSGFGGQPTQHPSLFSAASAAAPLLLQNYAPNFPMTGGNYNTTGFAGPYGLFRQMKGSQGFFNNFNMAAGGFGTISDFANGNSLGAGFNAAQTLPIAVRQYPSFFNGLGLGARHLSGSQLALAGFATVGGLTEGVSGALNRKPVRAGLGLATAGAGIATFSPAIFKGAAQTLGVNASAAGALQGLGVGVGVTTALAGFKQGGATGALETAGGGALTAASIGGAAALGPAAPFIIGASLLSGLGLFKGDGAELEKRRRGIINDDLPNILQKVDTLYQSNPDLANKEYDKLRDLLRIDPKYAQYLTIDPNTGQIADPDALNEVIRGKHVDGASHDHPLSVKNLKNRHNDLKAGGVWDTRLDQEIADAQANPSPNSPALSGGNGSGAFGGTSASSGDFFGAITSGISNLLSELGSSFSNIGSSFGLGGLQTPGVSALGFLGSLLPMFTSVLGNNDQSRNSNDNGSTAAPLAGKSAGLYEGTGPFGAPNAKIDQLPTLTYDGTDNTPVLTPQNTGNDGSFFDPSATPPAYDIAA